MQALHIFSAHYQENTFYSQWKIQVSACFIHLFLFQAWPEAGGWTEQIQRAGGCRHAPFLL